MADAESRKMQRELEQLRRSHVDLSRLLDERTRSLKRVNDRLKKEIDKLRRTEAALRESEEKYRSLVESTDNSIYLVDKECNYLYMNRNHQQRLGLSADQVKGTAYADCHSRTETRRFRQKVNRLLETGESLSYEYRSKRDGQYFLRTLSPIMQGADIQAVSVMSKNITFQKQAEKQALHHRMELAHLERIATMGELTASLAHELNQPLTAILSNAQAALHLLAAQPPEIKELAAIIEDIIADNRRASRFIQHLRAFFKKGRIEKKPLDINDLVQAVISLVRSEAVLNNVAIETAIEDHLPLVKADGIHLQQVLINLVINASESMQAVADRPKRLLISAASQADAHIKIGVQDTGEGIAPDIQDAIFNPHFTTKKNGMGMGLAICRSIVSAHDGEIWAVNHPDQGVCFFFTLPVTEKA